jgi:cell wall-associated NlpC family hydrolase
MIDDSMKTTAEDMLGWPYKELGRGPDGIDCLGVVLRFYAETMGIPLPDPVSHDPSEVINSVFHDEWNAVEIDGPRDGDVARFTKDGREHLGIVLGRAVLHASRRGGVIVTPIARLRPTGYHRHRSFGAC